MPRAYRVFSIKLSEELAAKFDRLRITFGFDDRASFVREVIKQLDQSLEKENMIAQCSRVPVPLWDGWKNAIRTGRVSFRVVRQMDPPAAEPAIEEAHKPGLPAGERARQWAILTAHEETVPMTVPTKYKPRRGQLARLIDFIRTACGQGVK